MTPIPGGDHARAGYRGPGGDRHRAAGPERLGACWLIDPQSGRIGFWTEDGGIDGRTPVDLDELDLIPIEPLPSWVWYRDMADFAEGVSDQRAGRSLARAIEGKGAFRRFKDRLHQNYPDCWT